MHPSAPHPKAMGCYGLSIAHSLQINFILQSNQLHPDTSVTLLGQGCIATKKTSRIERLRKEILLFYEKPMYS